LRSTPNPCRFQQTLHDRHSAEQARSGRAQGYQTEARGDIVRRQWSIGVANRNGTCMKTDRSGHRFQPIIFSNQDPIIFSNQSAPSKPWYITDAHYRLSACGVTCLMQIADMNVRFQVWKLNGEIGVEDKPCRFQVWKLKFVQFRQLDNLCCPILELKAEKSDFCDSSRV